MLLLVDEPGSFEVKRLPCMRRKGKESSTTRSRTAFTMTCYMMLRQGHATCLLWVTMLLTCSLPPLQDEPLADELGLLVEPSLVLEPLVSDLLPFSVDRPRLLLPLLLAVGALPLAPAPLVPPEPHSISIDIGQ